MTRSLPIEKPFRGQPESTEERHIRARAILANDLQFYAERCLKIRTKAGAMKPFVFNAAQRYIHAQAEDQIRRQGWVRKIVLKGRQQGVSTLIGGRFYHRITHSKGVKAFILTHSADATDNLFGMTERFHEHCPPAVRPMTGRSNAKELAFTLLQSGYRVGTARSEAVGRSETLQLFHGSEVAYWENAEDHVAGILQAVPTLPGTEIWLESTANGLGNFFHSECIKSIKGKSNFEFIFVPWFWQDEYRMAVPENFRLSGDEERLAKQFGLDVQQVAWHRFKTAELGESEFKREYPCTPEEAFEVAGANVLIGSLLIRAAIGREVAMIGGPVIWGVDPSLGGGENDRKTLAKRQTNHLLEPVKEMLPGQRTDPLQLAGAVVDEFRRTPEARRPRRICVDSIGIGAGTAAGLRAANLPNCEIVDVNVAEHSSSAPRFMRLRDELWWKAREWFEDMGVSMPDDDDLVTELASVLYDHTAAGRVQIESKRDMKKRLKYSPDKADAFIITFAGTDFMPPSAPRINTQGPVAGDPLVAW